MTSANIHPLAQVDPQAHVAPSVVIEPYAIVKAGVTLNEGVVVKSHAYLEGNVTVGENTIIYSSAVIGSAPQHERDEGLDSTITIGRNCHLREFVTINRAIGENGKVAVGDNCLIMAYSHLGHNCILGDNVVMANQTALAGHVEVEDHARIGGLVAVHQFVRIGTYAMVGGMSRVAKDIPPYTIGTGIPYKFGGLNMVGLRRNGFPLEVRRQLSKAYRLLFRSGLSLTEALNVIEKECEDLPEIRHWLAFCRKSSRGIDNASAGETVKGEVPAPALQPCS